MKKNITKFIQYILIKLKILKLKKIDSKGNYVVSGVYPWNPLSYVVVLIISIVMAIQSAVEAFIKC